MSEQDRAYLLMRAGLVEDRVRALVRHRREDDPSPDDPFRGLYLSDEAVDRVLAASVTPVLPESERRASVEGSADAVESSGSALRLRMLARAARLSGLDVEVLIIALVPDLDSRFERLYGYLNDDVTRRRASVGLALELAGTSPVDAAARGSLASSGVLVERGLVLLEDLDRPFLTRALRVPDRVTAHLLGDDTMDPRLRGITSRTKPYDVAPAKEVGRAISSGVQLVHVRERVAGMGAAVSAAALRHAGRSVVSIDLTRLAGEPDPDHVVTIAAREALLAGGGLVAGPVDALAAVATDALDQLCTLPMTVLLFGTTSWDPNWSRSVPMLVDTAVPGPTERVAIWQRELGEEGSAVDASATAHFVLGPGQIERAVQSAKASALLNGAVPTPDQLRRGARSQNAAGLDRLARRIEPEVGWDDLVLPASVRVALHDLAARARHRDRVLTEWRMRPGGGRGTGITALFAGDSGTGKTMSAEAIATELGMDLYAINLATVIDKYVGETEKNLERIFTEASGVNAVLLFDEADAVFGKRSEVRDAHDRYANIESAYLLQRMESFDGLAVLATNLRSNIDEAFTRRLDAIIDFPAPTETLRLAIWQRCLAEPLPSSPDLDLAFCARAFPLSGGNIRSVAITAAYRAADAGRPIEMTDLVAAVQQEYRKLGRLVLEQEFGEYWADLR